MRWNDKPEVSVSLIAPDDTVMGNKCRVRIVARGWGKLSIVNEHSHFTAYFAGEKSWVLTLPKSESTKISVSNLFGGNQPEPGLSASQKFMSEDEFFKNLRPIHKLPVVDVLPPPSMRLPRAARAVPLTNKVRGNRIRVASARIKFTEMSQKPVVKKWQPATCITSPLIRNNFRLKVNPNHMQFRLRANPLDIEQVFKTINREGAPQ